jgi:hypothetical protein
VQNVFVDRVGSAQDIDSQWLVAVELSKRRRHRSLRFRVSQLIATAQLKWLNGERSRWILPTAADGQGAADAIRNRPDRELLSSAKQPLLSGRTVTPDGDDGWCSSHGNQRFPVEAQRRPDEGALQDESILLIARCTIGGPRRISVECSALGQPDAQTTHVTAVDDQRLLARLKDRRDAA